MPLPEDEPQLEALLAECVVRVVTPGGHGSGFFVAPGVVLTCYHVVSEAAEEGAEVTVAAHDGTVLPAVLGEHRGPGWPDLALLDVPQGRHFPCVLLGATPVRRDERMLVGGYPANTQVDYQTRGYVSGGEENYGNQGGPYLRLDGDPLVGGMSGAPVVDRQSGFVRAVVRLTMDDRIPVGGFAVPILTVLDHLAELRPVYDRPGPAARRWTALLGTMHLRQFRRDADGSRWEADAPPVDRIDLQLTPSGPEDTPLVQWRVKTDTTPGYDVVMRVSDLDPDTDVMEAVDRWSRRRSYSRREEVELLGKLLYRWLLPSQVRRLVDEKVAAATGSLLLRVQVDATNRLAAIPWEYARQSRTVDPLSALETLALVRTVAVAGLPVTLKEHLNVLVVVVSPEELQDQLPGRMTKSGLARPSPGEKLLQTVTSAMPSVGNRITVVGESDVSIDRFESLLAKEAWDVVHYVGFGWEEEPALGFMEGTNMVAVPLSTVISGLGRSQATLVVANLLPLPVNDVTPPLGAAGLFPLISSSVQGLVVAQNTLTDSHVTGFTSRFYAALQAGESVEVAAQRARRGLLKAPPDMDYSAFGGVTVTTTHSGDLRLLTANHPAGRGSGPQSPPRAGGPTSRKRRSAGEQA